MTDRPVGPAVGSLGGLRVAQVICSDGFAGAERHVASLTRALAARDCEVVTIGGAPDRMPAELAGSSATWHPAATISDAVRVLRAQRPVDVVHVHMTAAEAAAVAARPFLRAPIVATRHFARRRGSSAAARIGGRVLAASIKRQIAISRYVADNIDGASTVIYPGLPGGGARAGVDAAAREPAVLVAQRFEREKSTDLALRVWAESGLAAQGWRLWLAGDGALRGELRELARGLDVGSSVDFLGMRDDLPTLMRTASMFVATCSVEGLGLSVLEAMSAELPVVAVAGGGHAETAGRADGAALFAAAAPEHGGALLRELAGDDDRRQRYAAALGQVVDTHFTVDGQADRTLALYRSAL